RPAACPSPRWTRPAPDRRRPRGPGPPRARMSRVLLSSSSFHLSVGSRCVSLPAGSMRRVRELVELAGDEVLGLLADVDGVVADPLDAARDDDHPHPPLL